MPPTEYPDGQVYVKLGATRHDQWVLSPEDRREWMTGTQHEADLDWFAGLMLGVLPGLQRRGVVDQAVPDPRHADQAAVPRDHRAGPRDGGRHQRLRGEECRRDRRAGCRPRRQRRWTDTDLDEQSFKLISRD